MFCVVYVIFDVIQYGDRLVIFRLFSRKIAHSYRECGNKKNAH